MARSPIFHFPVFAYGWIIKLATWLQSVFLLIIRLYWGWQFHLTGMGKLQNIAKVTGYFQSLGIPYPGFNARMAGMTECFGGLFLLAGLASRVTTIPLIATMSIAYLTAFPDAVKNIFSKPDDFTGADPFLFLLTAVIVFLFGPGLFSLDGLIGFILKRRATMEDPRGFHLNTFVRVRIRLSERKSRDADKKQNQSRHMKTLNHKALIAGAAFAGLMTGTAARLHAAQTHNSRVQVTQAGTLADDSDKGKHACKGQNDCKGQGGCKTDANSCKGQNACKGKGGCATNKI